MSADPLGDRASATLFAHCPECHTLWLNVSGDTLVHYPGGGFGDASGSADTLDDAKVMADYFEGSSGDDTQIFDCVERRIVG